MNDNHEAKVFVTVDAGGFQRVELVSKEVPIARALRMFEDAANDHRAIEMDIVESLNDDVEGAFLYVGFHYMDEKNGFVEDDVKFAKTHAFDAIERYFGFATADLTAALDPHNVRELVEARRTDYAEFFKGGLPSAEDLEPAKTKHIAIQNAIKADLQQEFAESAKMRH